MASGVPYIGIDDADIIGEETLKIGDSASIRNFYDVGKSPNLEIIENVSVERPLMWIDLGDTPPELGQARGQIPSVNADTYSL